MNIRKFQDVNMGNKKILLRVDYNVPMKDGHVAEDTRIVQTIPTIKYLLKQNTKVILVSHLGRPDGKVVEGMRMTPIAKHLSKLLKKPVKKLDESIGPKVEKAVAAMKPGNIVFLENIRFHKGEEKNDPAFAKKLASLADIYVSDSFATAHRAHASTAGVTKFLPSYGGFLMQKEVEMLSPLLQKAEKPLTVIMGGAKIDTKIGIIENFLSKADYFLIGGGLANTFLAAEGFNVGKSLYETDKIETAQNTLLEAESLHGKFILPIDAVVADEVKENAQTLTVPVEDVLGDMRILDIGSKTIAKFVEVIKKSKTVIWNGPLGLSEMKPFRRGTAVIAQTLVWSPKIKSIIGGGDTVDAIKRVGFKESHFTFVSTGGGAMLEFLEGKMLPGVQVLLEKQTVKKSLKKTAPKRKTIKKSAKKVSRKRKVDKLRKTGKKR